MMSLEVRGAKQPPLGPKLESALFSNNGVSVIVNFNVDTDRMGMSTSFSCSQLMSFEGDSSSSCTWTSFSSISISLGTIALSKLVVNSEIRLISDKVKAACDLDMDIICSSYYSNSQETISISAPLKAISPSVSLSMFPEVFICDGITMDPTGSYGSCGRPWAKVQWSVTSVDGKDVSNLISYLNSNYFDLSSVVYAPTTYLNLTLITAGKYSISLTITNLFGRSSSLTKTVNVIAYIPKPLVSINGKSTVNVNRPDTLSLSASASVIVCGNVLNDDLVYSWRVYEGIQIISLASSSVDPRYFKVVFLLLLLFFSL